MKTTAKSVVQRNAGHPWDGQARPNFDLLHVSAENQTDMNELVRLAEKKFWHTWLIGLIGVNEANALPGGVMYKPCGIMQEWDDSPKKPHPGCKREPASEVKEAENNMPSKSVRHRP